MEASDASKTTDARKRDYLFGHLDPNRVQFSMGRDVRLDPPPCAETLNDFIYPYAEGDGRALTPVSIRFEYRDLRETAAYRLPSSVLRAESSAAFRPGPRVWRR